MKKKIKKLFVEIKKSITFAAHFRVGKISGQKECPAYESPTKYFNYLCTQ